MTPRLTRGTPARPTGSPAGCRVKLVTAWFDIDDNEWSGVPAGLARGLAAIGLGVPEQGRAPVQPRPPAETADGGRVPWSRPR